MSSKSEEPKLNLEREIIKLRRENKQLKETIKYLEQELRLLEGTYNNLHSVVREQDKKR